MHCFNAFFPAHPTKKQLLVLGAQDLTLPHRFSSVKSETLCSVLISIARFCPAAS
jgi:hypothetical protein